MCKYKRYKGIAHRELTLRNNIRKYYFSIASNPFRHLDICYRITENSNSRFMLDVVLVICFRPWAVEKKKLNWIDPNDSWIAEGMSATRSIVVCQTYRVLPGEIKIFPACEKQDRNFSRSRSRRTLFFRNPNLHCELLDIGERAWKKVDQNLDG